MVRHTIAFLTSGISDTGSRLLASTTPDDFIDPVPFVHQVRLLRALEALEVEMLQLAPKEHAAIRAEFEKVTALLCKESK